MLGGKEKSEEIKNCTIVLSPSVMRLEMLPGVATRLSVLDFQGSDKDIIWSINPASIANADNLTGISNMIRGISPGNAYLTVTDRSVGPNCNITLPIIITSIQDECTIDVDCNDNNLSTKDICSGTPRKCSHTKITECINGDNYCPSGCSYENDNDCEKPKEVSPEIVDCGTDEGETIPTKDNPTTSSNCITEKVKSCSPAKYSFISISPGLEGKTTATIQGISGDKCLMKFEFITHPIPEFSGTEMTCKPSMADKEAAFAFYFVGWSVEGCTGSFVNAFNAKQQT